ncbi:MAG: hypothetical protein ACUVRL_11080 [Candidatus Saccharicenans sp.]|uniref:hypothetical protein n=1 Tax=Candidatus Saccharicenans sp. TaxID=2819258 RepID=UPI00404B5C3C
MSRRIHQAIMFFLVALISTNLVAQYPDARRTGEEVLYESLLGAKGFFIVVESNGCTLKESFQIETSKKNNQDGTVNYILTVLRKTPDECKKLPEKIVLYFDLEKDLGLRGKFTYSLSNRIFPAPFDESLSSIVEKYFTPEKEGVSEPEKPAPQVQPVKTETLPITALKEELKQTQQLVRSELKKAMLFSIQTELERYRQRGDQKKVAELSQQLEKYRSRPDQEFPLPQEEPQLEANPLPPAGPILPPQVREAEVIVSEPLKTGYMLKVVGMTKSGPFYHLAGSHGDVLSRLQPGKRYKVWLCLIYKREYFGFIPNYYVYLAGIKD